MWQLQKLVDLIKGGHCDVHKNVIKSEKHAHAGIDNPWKINPWGSLKSQGQMEVEQGNKINFQACVHASIFKAILLTCFLYWLYYFYYYNYYLNTSEHKIYFKSKSFRICIQFIATLYKQILYRNLWIIFHLKNLKLSVKYLALTFYQVSRNRSENHLVFDFFYQYI